MQQFRGTRWRQQSTTDYTIHWHGDHKNRQASWNLQSSGKTRTKGFSCINRVTWTVPRNKRSLLKRMLDLAKRLSSMQDFLGGNNLSGIFLKLKYPEKLLVSVIKGLQQPLNDTGHTSLTAPYGSSYLSTLTRIKNLLRRSADSFPSLKGKSIMNCAQFLRDPSSPLPHMNL